jgi:hypothetical protein
LLVACTSSQEPGDPGTCFPVPAGANVLLVAHRDAMAGEEEQGTHLQGQGAGTDDIPMQGTSLQGQGGSLPGMSTQSVGTVRRATRDRKLAVTATSEAATADRRRARGAELRGWRPPG